MDNESIIPSNQITFYYTNGQSESFLVGDLVQGGVQDIRREIRRFLQDQWWILKLAEETVFINAGNVLKVEIRPPIGELEGEGVIANAERVTPLNRVK